MPRHGQYIGCFMLLAALAGSREALAAEPRAQPDAGPVAIVRFGLPFTGFDATIRLESASIAWRPANLFEAELGEAYSVNPCVHGPSLSARAGVSPSGVDVSEKTRWNLRTPVLLGYTFYFFRGGGCDANPDAVVHSLTIAAGFDGTYWGRDAGFDMRLLSFAGVYSEHDLSTVEGREWDADEETYNGVLYGMMLDIGYAWTL